MLRTPGPSSMARAHFCSHVILVPGRADYFGSVPNLAARLMAVAQPGQLLVDGRLGSMHDLQWRDSGGALLLSPQAGAVEFMPLGYLQVKVRGGQCGAPVQLQPIGTQRRAAAGPPTIASPSRRSFAGAGRAQACVPGAACSAAWQAVRRAAHHRPHSVQAPPARCCWQPGQPAILGSHGRPSAPSQRRDVQLGGHAAAGEWQPTP